MSSVAPLRSAGIGPGGTASRFRSRTRLPVGTGMSRMAYNNPSVPMSSGMDPSPGEPSVTPPSGASGAPRIPPPLERQLKPKRRPYPRRRVRPDPPAMLVDDRLGDRQPKTRPAMPPRIRRVKLLELLEQPPLIRHADPRPFVRHLESHGRLTTPPGLRHRHV